MTVQSGTTIRTQRVVNCKMYTPFFKLFALNKLAWIQFPYNSVKMRVVPL